MKLSAIFRRQENPLVQKANSILEAIRQTIDSHGGWFRVSEPFPGAWQQNIELSRECVLAFSPLYACITLIASDISKLRPRIMEEQPDGTYVEKSVPAFSPVLEKPNSYQTRIQFWTCWILSRLIWGNAYVLLERDARRVVVAMYVLDPRRVRVMVASDGSIFYEISGGNELAGITSPVTVPSSEVIHDLMNPLFHPLCGVSPIFACGLAASAGLEIGRNATMFFRNGAKISGILQVPGAIPKAQADALKASFNDGYTGDNAGKIAVLADGVKFQPLTMNSTDAQMIELLKLSAEQVCSVFHVPAYMVGVGAQPPYNNIEALQQMYYSQCLQNPIESIECLLDDSLGLRGTKYCAEFDLDGILRMDTPTLIATLKEGVGGAIYSPNEARSRLNLPPVKGGEQPIAQQQNWPLNVLADRAPPTDGSAAPQLSAPDTTQEEDPAAQQRDFDLVMSRIGIALGKSLEAIKDSVDADAA